MSVTLDKDVRLEPNFGVGEQSNAQRDKRRRTLTKYVAELDCQSPMPYYSPYIVKPMIKSLACLIIEVPKTRAGA